MIERLKELMEKATPGPWDDCGNKIGADGRGIAEVDFDKDEDRHLTVSAVNALPTLLEAAEALEKMCDQIEKSEAEDLFGHKMTSNRMYIKSKAVLEKLR